MANIADYLTNTKFYLYLSELFSNEENPSSKTSHKSGSVIREIENKTSKEKIWYDTHSEQSNRNSKISEWLKPDRPEPEPESSNTLYYIIAGVIITGLAWYYFDDIKDITFNLIEWFKGNNNPGNNPDNNNNILENRDRTRERLEKTVRESILKSESITAPELEQLIQSEASSSKSVRIISPSLEDLNAKATDSWSEPKSPGSTSSSSSGDTIKPFNSDKIKIDSPFPLTPNFLAPDIIESSDIITSSKVIDNTTSLLDIKDNWKNIIKTDLKDSILYVENHLPKSELDDTTYITKLLKEIKNRNIIYLKELEQKSYKLKPSKIIWLTQIGKNIDNWAENIEKEINKFN